MKHHFGVLLLGVITATLLGCSGGDPNEMKREIAAGMSNKQAKSAHEYYDKSVELARMNGCWNCHHVHKDLIGPSWLSVSEHYKNNPDARKWLIEKVKKGGSGVWNDVTSGAVMPANSPRVSDQDIGELVDFILSLAKGGEPKKTN